MAEPDEPVAVGGQILQIGLDGRQRFLGHTIGILAPQHRPHGFEHVCVTGELRRRQLVLKHAVAPVGRGLDTCFALRQHAPTESGMKEHGSGHHNQQ